jgi:hypothetical protein
MITDGIKYASLIWRPVDYKKKLTPQLILFVSGS